MKKIVFGVIIFVSFFIVATKVVTAQSDAAPSTSPRPAGIFQRAADVARSIFTQRQTEREESQEAREIRKATQSARRAEKKENIQEKRQEARAHVAQVHSQRLNKRFAVYAQRLESIIERLQNRINILSQNGVDITAAQAKLNEAKSALTQAKTKAQSAVSAFDSVDPDEYEQQRALALQAADIAKEAREDFQEVMSLVREAIQLLKTN